jgi:hypothetical protein
MELTAYSGSPKIAYSLTQPGKQKYPPIPLIPPIPISPSPFSLFLMPLPPPIPQVSLLGACLITSFWPLLGYGSYLLCSRQTSPEAQWPSHERIFLTLLVYVFGIVLMMGSDGQKHFVLKYRKGLISDGFFSWSRNTNYLGEMMIYSSFALLVQGNQFHD